jgi:hypothetical protein
MNYKIGCLLGRLSNGFQSDHGTKYHAVVLKKVQRPACPFNDFGRNRNPETDYVERYVALCGTKPGPRSVGWDFQNGASTVDNVVTCPRCLKKLEKGEPR